MEVSFITSTMKEEYTYTYSLYQFRDNREKLELDKMMKFFTALRKANTEILEERDDLQQSLAESSAEKTKLRDQMREIEEKVTALESSWKASRSICQNYLIMNESIISFMI